MPGAVQGGSRLRAHGDDLFLRGSDRRLSRTREANGIYAEVIIANLLDGLVRGSAHIISARLHFAREAVFVSNVEILLDSFHERND